MESKSTVRDHECRVVKPGAGKSLIGEGDEQLTPPAGWVFLPAGDAGLTRKVTSAGTFWRVQVQLGRRSITKGVWAPGSIIAEARRDLETLRSTAAYKKRLAGSRRRRDVQQAEYEQEFFRAVRDFLAFAPRYEEVEKAMAAAVTAHAIPIGSGTVARTLSIPIEERAIKAVIAWMRHQTTAYESMRIARVKGQRRAVRRMLAQRSGELLQAYRQGLESRRDCPLQQALARFLKAEDSFLPL